MKKTVLSTLIALSTLTLAGAASAQGMNPYYASGINNGQNGYLGGSQMQYQDPMADQYERYQYKPQQNRLVKFHVGADYHRAKGDMKLDGVKLKPSENMYGLILGADIPVGQKGTVALSGRYSDVISGADFTSYELSATYKHAFDSLGGTKLGIGADYRHDELKQDGVKSKSKSTWAHLTAEKDYPLSAKWKMTSQLKGSYLVSGKYSNGAGSVSSSIDQDKGYGAEFGVGFTRNLSASEVTVRPYYRYTQLGQSKKSHGVSVPKLTESQVGIQLIYTF